MVPALLAPLASGAASLVGWQSAKAVLPKIGSRLRGIGSRVSGWLGRNTGRAGAGAGGVIGGGIGGFGLSEIFDRLGIEDSRLQKLSIVAVVIGAVIAFGQVVQFNIGGGN